MRDRGSRPTAVRLVSWDLDGTLYSSFGLHLGILQDLARSIAAGRGRQTLTDIRKFQFIRRSVEAQRPQASLEETAGSADRILRDRAHRLGLERCWVLPVLRQIGPQRPVLRSIQLLRDLAIPQVVFSDFRVEEKLEAIGLEKMFDAVYAGEELGALKPSPRAFDRIASDFGLTPGAVLHIGDRADTDGKAASAAGCRFLHLGWPFAPASALPNILARLLQGARTDASSPTYGDREAET